MRPLSLILPLAFAALLVAPPSPATAKGALDTATIDRLRAYMAATMDALQIPGAAVVIVSRDGIEFAQGFGSKGGGQAPTPQTPFQIASLSKELTAMAVMQCIQAGTLNLDASVHSYLSWFGADGSDTARITVKDLLAHASGWSERDGLVNRANAENDAGALERNVRRLANTPLSHPIGQFEYSNANYDVLGYLVGVVSGQSYEDYMAQHVFAPLAMKHTHTDEGASRADGLAQGFYPFFGFPIPWDIGFRRSGLPSAYIASSAEDLGHVLIAHLNGGTYQGQQVLPAAAIGLLHQPLIHPDAWDGYGWGWWSFPLWDAGSLKDGEKVSAYQVPVVIEHTGSHDTYAGGMSLLPAQELGVVVLMNTDNSAAPSRISSLDTDLAKILLGVERGVPVASDEPVRQYGKPLLAGAAILMALGVAWAARRIRRWHRVPSTAPRGARGLLLHLILPVGLDVGVTALAWWLVLDTARLTLPEFPVIVHEAPDVGLALAAIAVLGLGWGLARTALTIRVLRESAND
jgi:CubicO group peptidase (beta-lactamase class C family)